jgi:hypothetical protein
MSARQALDLHAMIASVTIGALAAVVFFLLLSLISRPPGLQSGLAVATRQVDEAETKLQSSGDPYAYPSHALCRDAPDLAVAKLRERLTASGGGPITITNVSATAGVADEATGGLVPIALQFEADGRYDAVVNLLGGLARSEPEIFVDSADLKSETSSVALTFSGRIYCSPSVPL